MENLGRDADLGRMVQLVPEDTVRGEQNFGGNVEDFAGGIEGYRVWQPRCGE